MKWIQKVNKVLRESGKYISGIAILLMMFALVTDVFMRNVFGIPLTGTYEIVQYILMPALVFPALGYVYWSGVLPRLTEIIAKTPKRFQKFNRSLINIIDIIIFLLLTYYSFIFAFSGFTSKMAVPVGGGLLPIWPIYFLVPLGFLFVLLEAIYTALSGEKREEEVGKSI
ncbi:TRAP transporter small permease [Oceanobacillus saliphilus]|uniref:TRAP transporter small permease n=1 Tax=Oceanobacillus saliphilus TaxID=2925834 RepID=UPI00201E420E|nr:TRAP transporter small permease [Oceanobacillus saliphilus]